MRILVCIDDTDNLESRGTGKLASMLASDLEEKGWGQSSFVTRHQLYVHPDVPYTSHNSAMCFAATLAEDCLGKLVDYCADFLVRESAAGSDPGLAVAVMDRLDSPEVLIGFGRQAKRKVLTKSQAQTLAARQGIYLSEHGGTGDGVIGALAGIGLRLSGNDGRVRGRLTFDSDNGVISVGDIIHSHPYVGEVRSLDGGKLPENEQVQLGDKIKAVLLDGRAILPVLPEPRGMHGARWRTCSKPDLENY